MGKLIGCQKRKLSAVNVVTIIVMLIVMLLFINPFSSFADGGRRIPLETSVGDTYLGVFYHQLGWQMVVYPYYLKSNSLWDAKGEKVDIDIQAEGILFRPIYILRASEQTAVFINAVVPVGRVSVKNPATGKWETSTGIGDIILVPFSTLIKLDEAKRLGLQLDLFIHLPFGDYQKGRLANLGTNQYSVEPFICLAKGWRWGSKELFTEIMANYLYNGENRDEQFRPGDMGRVAVNLALMADRLTVGLSARHSVSVSEDELYDHKVANSKVKLTEIGASVSYQISPKCNLYVRVMEGIDGENTAKATMIMGKIWFPF